MSTSALIAAKKRFETSLKKFEIPTTTTDKAEEWVPQRYLYSATTFYLKDTPFFLLSLLLL